MLGIAPIDRLGELTWLGPASVVVFGLVLGLVANAFNIRDFDRWMLLLILGIFTGAYPLMYFAQEFISLRAAILASSALVLVIIALRAITLMGVWLGALGTVLPAATILSATLLAATQTSCRVFSSQLSVWRCLSARCCCCPASSRFRIPAHSNRTPRSPRPER